MVSEHYGSAMSGFVRAGNPNTGAKYGSWELSRDDIVNQLSGQGLEERESGWITIRLRGEIPQEAGKTYFLCVTGLPTVGHGLRLASVMEIPICPAGIGFIPDMISFSAPMLEKPLR